MTVKPLLPGALLLSLFVASSAAGATSTPVANLVDWSFRPGDSPVDAQGQPTWITEVTPSKEWRPMAPLSMPEGDAHGVAWLRIALPAGEWRDPTLFVGSVGGGAAEFYTTHRLAAVGQLHPEGIEERDTDAWTMVPLDRADLGKVLFVRLQQTPRLQGITRALQLGNSRDHMATVASTALPALMTTGVLLLLACIALAGFLRQRRDLYLLACGVFSFCAAILCIGISGGQTLIADDPAAWFTATVVGALLMTPALGAFLATAIVTRERPGFALIVRLYVVLALVGAALALGSGKMSKSSQMLVAAFIVSGLLTNIVVGVQEALRGNDDARVFAGGIAVFFIVMFTDALGYFGVIPLTAFHTHLGLLAVTLALAAVVVRRALKLQTSLNEHMKASETRHAVMARLSRRLADNARILVGAVERLRQSSDVQSGLVDRQAATMQEILATAQEINQAARIAAEKATAVMGSAARADEANQSIGKDVDEGLGGISTVAAEVAETASRMRALEQRTRQIAGIVNTVKDLADQSNMLALNAAIEAVRSGEAGKGFVVVAREMRSLADLSLQATTRIREVLASANDGIREAADLGARGEARIQRSLTQLQGTGTQLRALGQIVHDSNSNVRQISAAIGQQSAGVAQVFMALNDFNKQMSETVERLRETREAAASVESVASAMSAALAEAGGTALSEVPPAPAEARQAAA